MKHARLLSAFRTKTGSIPQIANSDAPSFIDALTAYLSPFDLVPTHACIAAAGLVKSGTVQLTNYNWEISARELAERFGFADAALIGAAAFLQAALDT